MIRTFIVALMMLPVGVLCAAESACVETLLCNDVKPADEALFEKYFGNEMVPVGKCWDAETLTEYSSSWGRNEVRKAVLCERIMQLSEDGRSLRYLSCVRFKKSDGRRVNYKEQVQHAVVPYVFMSNLVSIVDEDEQRVYFDIVKFNPHTRRIEGIEKKSMSFGELKKNLVISEIKPEHEQILARYFTGCTDEMAPQWDASHRVRYSARRIGTRGKPGYKLVARLEHISEDGNSLLFIEKELERSEGNKICWDCVATAQAVSPGLFAIIFDGSLLILHLPEDELGVRLKPRLKKYRPSTLELISTGFVD
ncbi:MAG: hypothetical protein IKZ07_00315 [Akkermansia sp.]|nr:hypothetical protein [Akkermansia sp.]